MGRSSVVERGTPCRRAGCPGRNVLGWLEGDDEASKAAADIAARLRARLDVAADQYASGDRG